MENKFAKPTTLEKMGFTHPENPLIGDWKGRKEWVDNTLKTYKPSKLLSSNSKTQDPSINLPIVGHCLNKTEVCERECYALKGTQAFSLAQIKAEYLSRYLLQSNHRQLIGECSVVKSVRLNGGGDLLPGHAPAIIKLAKACKETVFWGMSRNKEVLKSINESGLKNLSLLYSIDASTPPHSYVDYPWGLVWGPRLAGDEVPLNDPRLKVIFPMHQGGKVRDKAMPKTRLDCRAIENKSLHCNACKRCFTNRVFHSKA